MLKEKKKICVECGKRIPESRIKSFPKQKIITCSKKCSNLRSSKPSNERKNTYIDERGLKK